MQSNPWVVIKFGGNSVANLKCWQTIAKITQSHLEKNYRPLIVCSALSGTTNRLEKLLDAAVKGYHEPVLQEIISTHHQLAHELEVDPIHIQKDIQELSNLAAGISLLKEVSPAIHAKVLSFGEIFLTKLGHAYLTKHIPSTWCDARQLLKTIELSDQHHQSQFLAAKCAYQKDQTLLDQFNSIPTPAALIQGFIASNSQGETVILGRGGSDTSAAYFAAKLAAVRCEIWTDVPGIYTANPHEIPEARLLKSLDYDEAQEIASKGGKVLHPYCIPPLKANQIPLYVGCTHKHERQGTDINIKGSLEKIAFKSISTKYKVTLIQIEGLQMWQQPGFLADVFNCFKKHGLSVDLVSTSETTVTVSLDLQISGQDHLPVEALLQDLNHFCKATEIGPCAAISIIGKNIRSVLHKIGHALKIFEDQKIYLVSQSANDLNITFVVDEDKAIRLAKSLHASLIDEAIMNHSYDKSWFEEFSNKTPIQELTWWQIRSQELLNLTQVNSPIYVYDETTLSTSIHQLKNLNSINRIFYAIKANNNPDVLRAIYQSGLGFECVSIGEIQYILELFPNINSQKILFTPNFAPRYEYEQALALGVYVTVDNLYVLKHWGDLFKNRQILLRLDPGKGYGHHRHVCTGGQQSKFGIAVSDMPQIKQILASHSIEVIGLHAHIGSGIFEWKFWQETALFLIQFIQDFPKLQILNIGGGLGVAEKLGQAVLDLAAFDAAISDVKKLVPHVEFWLEPGRFLVAKAGILLTTVTQIKHKNEIMFIGVDAGMNSLIRPALYGSYHAIFNLSRFNQPLTQVANIVGPICESGDTIGHSRSMPHTEVGDVILIDTTGAYGKVMSSNYNLRNPANEIFLKSVVSEETNTNPVLESK